MDSKQRACNHQHGFDFDCHNGTIPPGWYCKACRFYLNFKPESFPDGIAYVDKENTKPQLPIAKSKY